MLSGSGRIELVGASYAACFFLIIQSCLAKDCASSCGNIHNIGHPFRLKTDPKHCGINLFELDCVANTAIWYVNVSGGGEVGYHVQAINYNNNTIRLTDPNVFMDNCTLRFMTSLKTYDDSIYSWRIIPQFYPYRHRPGIVVYRFGDRSPEMILWSCPFPLAGNLEVFNSSCKEVAVNSSNSASYRKRYWYVNVGSVMNTNGLEDSCRIEYRSWTSLLPEEANNISYEDLNSSLAFGFELTWYRNSDISPLWDVLGWSNVILVFYGLYKGLLCCCGTPCVTIFLIYKWRRRNLSAYDSIEKYLNCNQNNLMPIRYSYSQIKKMTNGFKEKLGQGGYGSVYKGKLRSGNFAAIKMLNKFKANGQDFINEVATIGRIHHTNVVRLTGFCVEGSKHALVYEFMINGSLDKYVLSKENCIPINNEKIYGICLGVARGIEYLHEGCNMQILHFDIKPHNILLDENFVPKISDFGLAKLRSIDNSIVSLTAARGTIGYMAPELFYKNIGYISYKVDVYSFGMLLMEVLGKRKNLNAATGHSSQTYFPTWIYDEISAKTDIRREDGREENEIVKKMIIVALWCIQMNPVDRPSMHEVIKMLEGDVEQLQIPPKPLVSLQEEHTNDLGLNTCSIDTSCNCSDTISLLIEAN